MGWLLETLLKHCLHWPALACIGLHWPALACIGLHWPALACIGLHWPALACIGLHWRAPPPTERTRLRAGVGCEGGVHVSYGRSPRRFPSSTNAVSRVASRSFHPLL